MKDGEFNLDFDMDGYFEELENMSDRLFAQIRAKAIEEAKSNEKK